MTIEQLDKGKLLISLCSQDMKDFSLSFDSMSLWDDHSRKVLSRLLHLASSKTGVSLDRRSVLVEAVPYDFGCILLVSLIEKAPDRKVYRVKRPKGKPCVRFGSATELLGCAEAVFRQTLPLYRNSLWLFEGEYYLVLDYPFLSEKARKVLGEFGSILFLNPRLIAAIKERGKVLCEEKAMSIVGERISKN